MRSSPTYDQFRTENVIRKVNGSRDTTINLSQEKVAAEHLTGSDAWDVFLQKIESLKIRAQNDLLECEILILNPNEVNMEVLYKAKIARAYHEGASHAYQKVIKIPKNILDS